MQEIQISHLLLAEDDEDDVLLFKTIIGELNRDIIVTVASDGNILMNLLQQPTTEADMIFLDLNMPYKNGFECLREIRANEKWSNVKVVILSTSSHPQQIETAYKGGADLYLAKPTSYNQFKNMMENCMSLNWAGLKQTV